MAKLTEAEKQEKEQAKAEKARIRAEKKAEKEANRPPKHQAKLDRARKQLPELNDAEQSIFDRLVHEFPLRQLEKISAHLNFYVRQEQTRNAVATDGEVTVGQTVRIRSGNTRHMGKVGVVTRAQRIRCYVSVPNVDKEIYLFTSDVEPVTDETVEMVDSQTGVNEVEAVAV